MDENEKKVDDVATEDNDTELDFNFDEEESDQVEDTKDQQKADRPKRTPQEEYEYFMGRAKRAAKKAGIEVQEKSDAPKKTESSKPGDDLDNGEKAYLRSALNLKGADELQLAKDWKNKYGSTVEEMEGDEVFLSRLRTLRDSRESMGALPKGKNRSGQSGITDTDLAIAKFKETGELPKDFKTRSAVVKAIAAEEQTGGMFDGPSVVGPRQGY